MDQEGMFETMEVVVDPGQSQLRIDKFLLGKIEGISRNRIQKAIKAGAVLVDEKEIKSNHKVRPNEVIKIVFPKRENYDGLVPEDIPLDIRYEDEDLIIVYKKAGMVVHPGVGNRSGTLVNALAHYLKVKDLPVMEGNDVDRPGLVHRIDKETSGLLVIAKNEFAMTHLAKQFFDHSIEREYVALVWGNFDDPKGTIEGNIGRSAKDRVKMIVFPDGDEGKHAVTHYEVLEDYYYVSLVKCKLETGRTHQIRVHMKYVGHPVFNDSKYGGNQIMKGTVFSKYKAFVHNTFEVLPRLALHAKSLSFIHPSTGKKVFFDTDLPDDIATAMERWKKYIDTRKEVK